MNDQHMAKADFFTAILLVVFSISIIVLSIQMPRMEEFGANPYSAPGIVPGFLGGILLLLGGILFARSVLRRGYRLNITGVSLKTFFQADSVRRVLLTIGISLIYGIGFLGRIPYVAATFIYVTSFILLFEYQPAMPRQKQATMLGFAVIQAVLVTGIVAAVFRYVFLVKLP